MRPTKVYVKRVAGKRYLQLAWIDPTTGKERRRSAGSGRLREAEAQALALERTLQRGLVGSDFGWREFCGRYESEHVATLKARSQSDWPTVRDAIFAFAAPQSLHELNGEVISRFAAHLRITKSVDTTARYLRTLRAALKWAENIRLIDEAPYVTMPRRTRSGRTMKGHPLCLEEFERMIDKVRAGITAVRKGKQRAEVTDEQVQSWTHTLWVYWLSGIRLSELKDLYWDRPDKLCIQGIDRERPMLLIHQELEKGNQDRLYPLPPDFVEYLRRTPEELRTGRVCRPLTTSGETTSTTTICRHIAAIGKAANVVVSHSPKKFASAHDLRRSFGTRWALLIEQPIILQQMMRHKSIQTTMNYYVHVHPTDTADAIHAAYAARSGDPGGDPKPKTTKSRHSRRVVS